MMSRDGRGDEGMIWGLLLHLGYNMWCDREAAEGRVEHTVARADTGAPNSGR